MRMITWLCVGLRAVLAGKTRDYESCSDQGALAVRGDDGGTFVCVASCVVSLWVQVQPAAATLTQCPAPSAADQRSNETEHAQCD